jgi:phage shock protein A
MAWMCETIGQMFKGLRRADEATAEKLRDPIADGKDAIQDAEREVAGYTSKVAELVASNRMIIAEKEAAQKDVDKFERLAVQAGQASCEADIAQALTEKKKAQVVVDTLTATIAQNDAQIAKLKSDLSSARDRIATAKTDQVQLSAVITGSKIRQGLAEASNALNSGDSALGKLGKLKEDAVRAQAHAEAAEEMANISAPGMALEQKYATPAVDNDEIAKYMKK